MTNMQKERETSQSINCEIMFMDATPYPVDISFPQAFHLLNRSRQTVGKYSADDLPSKRMGGTTGVCAKSSKGVLESVQEQEANQESNIEMHQTATSNLLSEYLEYIATYIRENASCRMSPSTIS